MGRVVRRSKILAEALFAHSGWPCAPESEARSDQMEPPWPRRDPRRLDRPVSRTQSEGKHVAGA
eukprot:scaffold22785_cov72-Phaeocystis_antarctica.AAC.12